MNQDTPPNLYPWLPFLLGLCSAIGMYAGYKLQRPVYTNAVSTSQPVAKYPAHQKIQDVFSYLQSKYVDSLNYDETADFLIQQLMYALDPYSEYLKKSDLKNLRSELDALYTGAGLNFRIINQEVYISELIPNSPAQLAGIEIGDRISEINNIKLDSLNTNYDSLQPYFNLYEDKISLKLLKPTINEPQFIEINKQSIPNRSVGPIINIDQKTFYLKIDRFSESTYREFMEELENKVQKGSFKNIVIDLRNNSGGLLNASADILNQLVDIQNIELFKTVNREGQERSFKSTGKPFFRLEKIFILINENSASASEILAGVLQDLGRAKIIGTNSIGKATVLELYQLADGSSLELANARIYLPSGRCIQKPYNTNPDSNLHWLSPFIADTSIITGASKNYPSGRGIIPDINLDIDEVPDQNYSTLKEKILDFIIVHYPFLKSFQEKKNGKTLTSTYILKNFINSSNDILIINNKEFILKESEFFLEACNAGKVAEEKMRIEESLYFQKLKEILTKEIQ